jgi:septal ring factor EnvC (AmiA/AmiB activator)
VLGVTLVAALGVGGWELRRLDQDVQSLQAEITSRAQTESRLDGALKSLNAKAVKLRESNDRQEFYAPLYAYETQLVTAVVGGADCAETKRKWQRYVNDTLMPFLNERKNRSLKLSIQHDDPDYHATLLNELALPC